MSILCVCKQGWLWQDYANAQAGLRLAAHQCNTLGPGPYRQYAKAFLEKNTALLK